MRNGLNSESNRGHNTPAVCKVIRCLIVAMVLLCSPAKAQNLPQKSTDRTRNVLVINSYRPTYDWAQQTVKGIEDTLEQYKDRIELKISANVKIDITKNAVGAVLSTKQEGK